MPLAVLYIIKKLKEENFKRTYIFLSWPSVQTVVLRIFTSGNYACVSCLTARVVSFRLYRYVMVTCFCYERVMLELTEAVGALTSHRYACLILRHKVLLVGQTRHPSLHLRLKLRRSNHPCDKLI